MNSSRAFPDPISSLEEEASGLGFVALGLSKPRKPLFYDDLCAWLASGKQGEMDWLAKNLEVRANPERLLKGCRTIVTLAYPYPSRRPCTPDGFTAARYSEPERNDYHDRLRKLAGTLARGIRETYPGSRTRVCVDSAPILERSVAYTSGIGFIGKNNMLIVPGYGSYLFLAEILTTAALPLRAVTPLENRCGTCNRCVEACPTGALERPFSIDASRCLSYLTIEYGGRVDRATGGRMGSCFFGCDRCQEVCPFNDRQAARELSLPSTEELLRMDEGAFNKTFGRTAFSRAGLEKIQGNIRAILTGQP